MPLFSQKGWTVAKRARSKRTAVCEVLNQNTYLTHNLKDDIVDCSHRRRGGERSPVWGGAEAGDFLSSLENDNVFVS